MRDAPGTRGPVDREVGWYDDEQQAVERCENEGCERAALPRQCGCLLHGACEVCGEPTDLAGPIIVVRADGIARCVSCAVFGVEH